jgi:hypothetical protein
MFYLLGTDAAAVQEARSFNLAITRRSECASPRGKNYLIYEIGE